MEDILVLHNDNKDIFVEGIKNVKYIILVTFGSKIICNIAIFINS